MNKEAIRDRGAREKECKVVQNFKGDAKYTCTIARRTPAADCKQPTAICHRSDNSNSKSIQSYRNSDT